MPLLFLFPISAPVSSQSLAETRPPQPSDARDLSILWWRPGDHRPEADSISTKSERGARARL